MSSRQFTWWKRFHGVVKIPKQHLGYIEDGNSKATLAGQDMRFAKTIA